MSAAVSDESVAGDSGVGGGGVAAGASPAPLSPQVMVSLNFDPHQNRLGITVERGRNLARLWTIGGGGLEQVLAVQIRGSLLPGEFSFRLVYGL